MTTESDDLGLGPGISFTFGDVAMYEALVQVSRELSLACLPFGMPFPRVMIWIGRLLLSS